MQGRRIFLTATAFIALAALPLAVRAQGAFEGVVTFQMQAGRGGMQTMQYAIKNGKVRMDIDAGAMQMFTLMNPAAKTVDMVIPMRQVYMEQTMGDDMMADSAAMKTKINWTGKKETIAGCECEDATVTNDAGETVDVCLAKGLGRFMSMRSGGMGRGMGRGREMAMGGGWEDHIGEMFPLKVSRGGQVQLEATKIEKKSLDDSMFSIPDGYQKMSMPMGDRMGRRGGGSR